MDPRCNCRARLTRVFKASHEICAGYSYAEKMDCVEGQEMLALDPGGAASCEVCWCLSSDLLQYVLDLVDGAEQLGQVKVSRRLDIRVDNQRKPRNNLEIPQWRVTRSDTPPSVLEEKVSITGGGR